jgi:hypothetical protein
VHERDARNTLHLENAVSQFQRQQNIHAVLGAAIFDGLGEQGIIDALSELTDIPVALEDRFGNLRSWSGPGLPDPYPKQTRDQRARLLRRLARRDAPLRVADRVLAQVKPRTEVLGILALIDPDRHVTGDSLFALQFASALVALELSHQRNIAEIELNVRRELVDDLLEGTDAESAYARAEVLGHDLRREHYTVVIKSGGRADSALAAAAGNAAKALHLNYLQGRRAGMVVLLTDGRPDSDALHRAISKLLGTSDTVIGVGSRCDTPADFPRSFAQAIRALNIRLRSTHPAGVSAYDELGFYRLIDSAGNGTVEDFVREWLGALLVYDETKHSNLVYTLSSFLENGGNYDDTAAAMHIHRSTLRYRLTRIQELTGFDIRDVDTRFNLHAATRAWRFLNPAD